MADLPGFQRHVTPSLQRRLATSAHAGCIGERTLDLYRGGVRLAFEQGKLTTIADWQRPVWGEGMAGYPSLVLVQVLYGYHSLDELRHIYPDVWAERDAVALLETLFPSRPSLLLPLE